MGRPDRVDRERGVIAGVKVLGTTSRNGRQYTLEAMRQAAPLYEGITVNADHPYDSSGKLVPSRNRSPHDPIGWLENVQVRSDGLYADLHLLNPSAPLSISLFTAAENNPSIYGLSHNCDGDGRMVDGVLVVERIENVRSVDLVTRPGSTNGLFESEQKMKLPIRSVLESLLPKLSPKQQVRLKSFLEADELAPQLGAEMEPPPDDQKPDTLVDDAFEQMVCSVFRDESLDARGKIKKISEIIKAQEKLLTADEEEVADDAEEEEESASGDDVAMESREEEKSEKLESLQRELSAMKAEKAIRILVEDAGLKFSSSSAREAFIESLIPLEEPKRRVLIEERRQLSAAPIGPRSRAPGTMSGSHGGAPVKTVINGKTLAEAIRRR